AFPMERFCGSLQPGIRSGRFTPASIDRYLVRPRSYEVAQELSWRLLGLIHRVPSLTQTASHNITKA
ncbi:hypothetical protein K438DRAFT_1587498, partial [Mycena galopus ATCC 62051]